MAADKTDFVMRIVFSWVLFLVGGAIAYIIADHVAVNPWVGASLFMIGWIAGRITRGIEAS